MNGNLRLFPAAQRAQLHSLAGNSPHLLRHWPRPGVRDAAKRALVAKAAAGAPSGDVEAARLGATGGEVQGQGQSLQQAPRSSCPHAPALPACRPPAPPGWAHKSVTAAVPSPSHPHFCFFSLCAELLEAPRAPQRPRSLETHGDVRQDAYYWLRDDEREAPDVIAHLKVGASPATPAGRPVGPAGAAALVGRHVMLARLH